MINHSEIEGKLPKVTSYRLYFKYENNKINLIDKKIINKIPPISDSLVTKEDSMCHWIELRDDNENIHYRRKILSPIRSAIETVSDNSKNLFTWHKVEYPIGFIRLIIPVIEKANILVFFIANTDPFEPPRPAKELIRFDLRKYQEKEDFDLREFRSEKIGHY